MSSVPFTVPGAPDTSLVSATLLSYMAAQSGVISDYNDGSQIRTLSEAIGSVAEIEGVIANALAAQAAVNAAYSVFGIVPATAQSSVGSVTFLTGLGSNPPPSSQNVVIGVGTVVGTTGGVQFQTSETITLLSGTTSVSGTVIATQPGLTGNVPAGSITTIISALPYPLFVTNPAPTTGGANAELPSQTFARLTSKILSFGLASPVAIANACIGIQAPNSTETVVFATVYEPWTVTPASGAGFDVYVDNGSGSASSSLLSAVTSVLNGSFALNESGYRPAGVPYTVNAVVPVYASVSVSGTVLVANQATLLQSSISNSVTAFFGGNPFGGSVTVSDLIAVVSNVSGNLLSSFGVTLYDSSGTSVNSVTPLAYGRVILTQVNVSITT
jgi:hypothetical protein